jgi:ATP-dependent exoDNAse (exonuclease V) beta subunit
VGDANQGIYRFRRADLGVFEAVREHLLTTGKRADLSVNFRSTPGLVALANRLFGKMLGDERYQPLQAHRQDGPKGPAVSLIALDPLLVGEEGDDVDTASTNEVREAEARALAWWIRQRVEEKWRLPDREGGKPRPMKYSDVAILIRAQSGVKVFEDVFERYGIRYRLSGGKAFFARLEVQQTLSVLEALADPGNEHAVVAALRSPYFGVSDESLVRWAASDRPFSYLGQEGEPDDGDTGPIPNTLDRGADAPLLAAMQFLRELRAESVAGSPAATLRELFARSRALPLHLLKPDGDRRMANLLKLLDLATAFEEAARGLAPHAGEGSLRGLVAHLKEQQKAAVEEESALVDEKGDAVTIMTMHKAKGLEFPVVAILDRAYRAAFRDDAIPDRERDVVHLKAPGLEPSDWTDWKETEKESQAEEARRLLYVAFTRAREHVVVCSTRTLPPAEGAFLAPLEIALREIADEDTELVRWETPVPDPGQVPTPHRLPFDVERPGRKVLAEAVGRRESRNASRRERVAAAASPPVRSASGLVDESDWSGMRSAVEARRHALRRGSLVHEAMEHIARLSMDVETAVAVSTLPTDSDELLAEAIELTRMGRQLLQSSLDDGWQVVGAEWPLMLGDQKVLRKVAPDCACQAITGVADLILKAADGRLRVVDFKTDDATEEDLGRRYGPQLSAYRAALESVIGDEAEAQIWNLSSGTRLDVS